MQVTIIGSGNVATVLARLFMQNGHQVLQVYSRNYAHARELAKLTGAVAIADLNMINPEAELFLLAVSDDALIHIADQLLLSDQLVLHTAGSVSKEVLQKVSSHYGVLWPMKMIRKSMLTLMPVTLVVDGNTEPVIQQIEKLALEFSPDVTRAGDIVRGKMHMLAAFTSNFTNHLYQLAADYCMQEKIDFGCFYPLIEETALRIKNQHPAMLQAGPAYRGDHQTQEKHRLLLKAYPWMEKLYQEISASIEQNFMSKTGDR